MTQEHILHQQQTAPSDSLDFIVDLSRERINAQFEQKNVLDTKANGIMTIASTLMGAALILQAALTTLSKKPTDQPLIQVVLGILFGVYLVMMLSAAIAGYWTYDFVRAGEIDRLIDAYILKPEAETKMDIVTAIAHVYEHNKRIMKPKVILLRIAALGFFAEIVVLVALLALQVHG